MKTFTLSGTLLFLLIAATESAQAQAPCATCPRPGVPHVRRYYYGPAVYFFDPSRQAVNWATAEQIRASANQQWALAAQEWIKANRRQWELNLEKREHLFRHSYQDAKAVVEARAELRAARETDLEARRSYLDANIRHQSEMTKIMQERNAASKKARIARNQLRKEKTGYVLDTVGGGIGWTGILLKDDRFSAERNTIDNLLAGKSFHALELSAEECDEILAAVKTMQQTLQEMIKEVPCATYWPARKFLTDLSDQVRSLVSTPGLQTAGAKRPKGDVLAASWSVGN
ncbi:MAG: hypothetical protein JXB10_03995 [Pirellulales bacterium]|nr:hypothetical protein [Pirellulales bacterium]